MAHRAAPLRLPPLQARARVAGEQQREKRLRNKRVHAALDSCVTSQVDTVLILTLLLLTFTGMVRLHRSPQPLTHSPNVLHSSLR
jgi:hypothetical protein